jgi:flagellar hook-associated protein 3 FlgL
LLERFKGRGDLAFGQQFDDGLQGQLAIGTNSSTAGIAVSSNDAVLGLMNATPGTAVANAYAYVGNSTVNQVQVGDSMNVASNLSGSALTGGPNAIGALGNLITALQSGSSTQIGAATTAISAALNYVGQQRVPFDNTISELNNQESYLGQEKVTLTTQQTSLVGISLSDAATNLSQAELTNNAVMAAAAKVIPNTLLDYLK